MKIDQAQFRELEAFAKFGSDLDAATKAVLDKGIRNVEILKQPQYSPMPIEKQVAIVFAGTRGLLKNVPVDKVRDFEVQFLHHLGEHHSDLLAEIRKGILDDAMIEKLEKIALDIAKQYTTNN